MTAAAPYLQESESVETLAHLVPCNDLVDTHIAVSALNESDGAPRGLVINLLRRQLDSATLRKYHIIPDREK